MPYQLRSATTNSTPKRGLEDQKKPTSPSKKAKKKSDAPTLTQFLQSTSVGDVLSECSPLNVRTLEYNTPLPRVIEFLEEHKISSCPIIKNGQVHQFIDMLDIVFAIVEVCKGQHPNQLARDEDDDEATANLELDELIWSRALAHEYAGRKGELPLSVVQAGDKLADVYDAILKDDVHRVAVVAANKSLKGVITQSSLFSFLSKKGMFSKHDSDLVSAVRHRHHRDLLTARDNTPTLSVFRMMKNRKVTALPLTNERGSIIECISNSDMKVFVSWAVNDIVVVSQIDLSGLSLPVSEFLERRRETSHPPRRRVMTVSPSSTVEEATNMILAHKLHRLVVIDDETKGPVGMITLTDLLSHLR